MNAEEAFELSEKREKLIEENEINRFYKKIKEEVEKATESGFKSILIDYKFFKKRKDYKILREKYSAETSPVLKKVKSLLVEEGYSVYMKDFKLEFGDGDYRARIIVDWSEPFDKNKN